jgi:hypothetical protein
MISALVCSLAVTALLALMHAIERLGWIDSIPQVILWPATASAIYLILYWLFDRHIWKVRHVADLLKVPNLAGKWHCDGRTLNADKSIVMEWRADIIIVQSWDRFRVRLKGQQSGSNSTSAALLYDEIDGFRLLYSYRNDPFPGELDIGGHRGFAELIFSKDLKTAEGEYFNGQGRFTFGLMTLTKAE